MNPVQLPVFVRRKDCGDIARYDSIAKMKSGFERIDVQNDEYEAWDALGTRLKLSVQKSDDWLRIDASPNSQPEQLAGAITEFASLQGVDVDIFMLGAGNFSGALAKVSLAIQTQWPSKGWWQRIRRRFVAQTLTSKRCRAHI
jgi:hypothetical protein